MCLDDPGFTCPSNVEQGSNPKHSSVRSNLCKVQTRASSYLRGLGSFLLGLGFQLSFDLTGECLEFEPCSAMKGFGV